MAKQLPFGLYNTETGEIVLNGYGSEAAVGARVEASKGALGVVWQKVVKGRDRVNVKTKEVERIS